MQVPQIPPDEVELMTNRILTLTRENEDKDNELASLKTERDKMKEERRERLEKERDSKVPIALGDAPRGVDTPDSPDESDSPSQTQVSEEGVLGASEVISHEGTTASDNEVGEDDDGVVSSRLRREMKKIIAKYNAEMLHMLEENKKVTTAMSVKIGELDKKLLSIKQALED